MIIKPSIHSPWLYRPSSCLHGLIHVEHLAGKWTTAYNRTYSGLCPFEFFPNNKNSDVIESNAILRWLNTVFKCLIDNNYFKLFTIWRPFFARVTVIHRRVYSHIIFGKVCAVAIATVLGKNKALKMVFVHLKNPFVIFFSLSAHYELTWYPFCQYSYNKILILVIFMIHCESFSVVLKIPYVKIQILLDRSFTWFLNYFLAKSLMNKFF